MPTYTDHEKTLYLNQAHRKVRDIGRVSRPYIDRAEEHARAYAEALADVGAITAAERETLNDEANDAAQARVRAFKAAEDAVPAADENQLVR